jgi:hypothetical protein
VREDSRRQGTRVAILPPIVPRVAYLGRTYLRDSLFQRRRVFACPAGRRRTGRQR